MRLADGTKRGRSQLGHFRPRKCPMWTRRTESAVVLGFAGLSVLLLTGETLAGVRTVLEAIRKLGEMRRANSLNQLTSAAHRVAVPFHQWTIGRPATGDLK